MRFVAPRHPWLSGIAALGLALAFAAPSLATIESDISSENTVSNLLPSRQSIKEGTEDEEGIQEKERGAEESTEDQGGDDKKGLDFAVFPQVGYGPETGPKAGIKFEGHDLFGGDTFLDMNLLFALRLQQKATITLGNPKLADGNLMAFTTLSWYRDPSQEFFGLGNNDVGPDELSNHDIRRGRIGVFLAYRILRRVALVGSVFYRETDVKPGEDDDTPTTTRFAPGLPGIGGARSNYLSAALVFNSRDEVARPTRGWELIFKYLWADHAFFNDDADFSKLMLDTSYVVPLVWRRQLIAIRANTEVMFGDDEQIPFFELSSLGGDESMRGYFPQRFLGKGRVLFNAEYRLKLFDFNFRKMWDVTIDGVGFGDAGRVYEDGDDFTDNAFEDFRFSYGGGLRIGLSSGLVARLDCGFSPEESALIYLTFGHTF